MIKMNKPINIQSFVCEISKCPDIQRLKEENERMKKWRENSIKTIKKLSSSLKNYISAFNNHCGEINLLKAENDSLKSQLDLFKNAHKTEQDRRRNYEQALEDVRKITKKYYLSNKKLLATGIGIDPYYAIIEIHDKINEVLNDAD